MQSDKAIMVAILSKSGRDNEEGDPSIRQVVYAGVTQKKIDVRQETYRHCEARLRPEKRCESAISKNHFTFYHA